MAPSGSSEVCFQLCAGDDAGLLATLVLIFAFQADNITGRYFHVILIAIPILIQVYFNSRFDVWTDEIAASSALRGCAWSADRRKQFL